MIETVTSVALPVNEQLQIKKQRIISSNADIDSQKRISIVTGTHGDELEGQFVCYELARKIKENIKHLNGIVDIYPAINPLGVDSITRGIPAFDLDMNRIFPGNKDGSMAEYVASEIIKDIEGSEICIDIHASNIFLTEIPQVRINEITKDTLLPYAKMLNTDFVWIHKNTTVLESTLAYSLNSIGTKTLVVKMGTGMRITKEYCYQLTDGIFNLMKELGIWGGETQKSREPIVSENPDSIEFINAVASGVFVPETGHWTNIKKGELIGMLIDPLYGMVVDRVEAPCDGTIFTLREYPVVDEGSLIAAILKA